MDISVVNGMVLTNDKDKRIIKNGIVNIDGKKIVEVGPTSSVNPSGEIKINAKGQIVMPGLIAAHDHLYGVLSHGMTGFPEDKFPSSFIGVLENFWWPYIEDLLTKEDIRHAAAISALEAVKTGTTCLVDVLEAPNAIPGALDVEAEVLEKLGIRSVLSFEASERVNEDNRDLGIRENLDFIKKHNHKDGLTKGMFCTHTTFTCSPEMLHKVRDLANQYKAGIQVHLEEGKYESLHSLVKYRKTPVEHYDDLGFLGPDVLASQCVHTTPKEIQILKKHDVKTAHNPLSNCEVGGGIAPIPDLLASGLAVGLGTDGYVIDMFEVMRAAGHIHKAALQDAAVMPPHTVFEMATLHGAKAARMTESIGSIEPGKTADLITIKPRLPTPVIPENVYSQIIIFTTGRDVQTSIIDGQLVMHDRTLKTVNEQELLENAHAQADRFWQKIADKASKELK